MAKDSVIQAEKDINFALSGENGALVQENEQLNEEVKQEKPKKWIWGAIAFVLGLGVGAL